MSLEKRAADTAHEIDALLRKYRSDKLAIEQERQEALSEARRGSGMAADEPSPLLARLRVSLHAQRRDLIRLQNDRFRITFLGDQIMMTSGVQGRGAAFVGSCLEALRTFDTFDESNDPYGEHDFGVLQIEGQKVYWKIDAYDRERCYGSEDPADPELTTRVLTLLLPEEY